MIPKTQKWLSVLLVLCLCFGMMPMSAFAGENDIESIGISTSETKGTDEATDSQQQDKNLSSDASSTTEEVSQEGKTNDQQDPANSEVSDPVAKVGDVGYRSLAAAVDDVVASQSKTGTVVLQKDASGGGIGLFNSKGATGVNLTIDFGGHTYTCADPAVGSTGTETQGFHLEKGNTVTLKNGKIAVDSGSSKTKMLIQNYCDLSLEDLTLTGSNITQYIVSCNYGDMRLKNVSISGTYNRVVAIDLMHWLNASYHDKAPTMTIENTADNTISGKIKIYCYGEYENVKALNCTRKPQLTITGGTFSTNVSKYCPSDYTCTQEGSNYVVKKATGLSTSVDTPTGSNKVSVTVTGVVPTTTENVSGDEGLGTSTPTEATIKATTGGDDSPKDATITIPASTAATMTSDTGYELTVEADAATVKLNKDAMSAVQSAAAGTGDDGKDISMEIKKTTVSGNGEDSPSTVYSVTVKAGDDEILSENVAPANTAITITVPAPADPSGTVYVWLMTKDSNGAWKKVSEVKGATLSDGKVIFTTKHLSDYAVFSNEQESDYEVSYTNSSNGITYGTFSDAITTVENNGAITLLKDVTLTDPAITLSKTVTIKNTEGENHKINVSMGTGGAAQIKTAFTLTNSNENVGKLTLDGVTMNVKTDDNTQTSDSARNAAFSLTNGTELNLTNGAQLNLDKLQTGMYMPGTVPVDAKVTVSGAGTKLTATDINGNFSNGGQFEVKDGAELSIVKCTSHGLSANKVNVENAKVTVKNTGLCGIITVDSNAEVTLGEGAEVVVENCATGSDSQNRAAVELSKSGTAKLTMDKNSSLAVSGTGDRSNKVALADNSGSTLNGNISGAVQQGSNAAVTYHQITFHVTPETATVVVKDSTGAVQNNVNNTYALKAGNYTYQVSANGYYTRTGSFTVDKSDTITVTLSQISTGGGGAPTYAVSVDSARNGSVSVSPKNASKGSTVTITVAPDKGYELDTLTVTDKDGKAVSVTKKNGTQYTFTMPASKVDVKATFKAVELKPTQTFIDVPINAYYADAVAWAVENGVTNGTGANTFSPDLACTRGQMVTFLWRAAGSPKASGTNPFTDLQPGSYYYDAVLWAVSQGITNGTSATTFSPEATVTRGQVVTFLYRYEKSPAVSGSNPFADVAADAYYAKAVQWAVREGITNGTGNNTFSPETDCTRGQIVTFLYRDMAD